MLLTRKTTAMPPLFLHNGTEMIQEVKTYKTSGLLSRMEKFDTFFALKLAYLVFSSTDQL